MSLFQSLSKNDQLLLLEGSWTQLFLLHLAQWSISWNITGLLEDEQVRARLPDEAFRIQYAVLGNFHQIEVNGDV